MMLARWMEPARPSPKRARFTAGGSGRTSDPLAAVNKPSVYLEFSRFFFFAKIRNKIRILTAGT